MKNPLRHTPTPPAQPPGCSWTLEAPIQMGDNWKCDVDGFELQVSSGTYRASWQVFGRLERVRAMLSGESSTVDEAKRQAVRAVELFKKHGATGR